MTTPIDIIIPVYSGVQETKTCLDSLLNNPQIVPIEVIVINDNSPEPTIVTHLKDLAQAGLIRLLSNITNLGFVASVNLGMQLHPDRDVVLLNSDTTIAGNWLERLHHCAYSQERIASVSPFSNNATICSYPLCCQNNSLPAGISLTQLDQCFATANAKLSVPIPTTVGFCMYIRREALQELGLFDFANFADGYGEENDFCMRARARGWQHLLCADVFVYHIGNVSFGDDHTARKNKALKLLHRRYPEYERIIFEHINADPARLYRQQATLARFKLTHRHNLLFISHNRQGGTLRHIRELTNLLAPQANILTLTTTADCSGAMELRFDDDLVLHFQLDEDLAVLCQLLAALNIERVHVHHTLGLPPVVMGLAERLGIPWDFTAHDYYTICPQINLTRHDGRYCGEPNAEECNRCLRLSHAPGRVKIQEWRYNHERLLNSAARCFAPSFDCMQRMQRYFPQANWRVVYHERVDPRGGVGVPPTSPAIAVRMPTQSHTERPGDIGDTPTPPLKILVIGALSTIKGADLLEDSATDAKTRGLPLTFILAGYAYRNLAQVPNTTLQVLGEYAEVALADILQQQAPDIIWFPALWPETYSYTLSAALRHGAPIVASRIGAFSERLSGRPLSWLVPWDWTPAQYNNFFLWLKSGPLQGSGGCGVSPHLRSAHSSCIHQDIGPYAAVNIAPAAITHDFDYCRDYLTTQVSDTQDIHVTTVDLHVDNIISSIVIKHSKPQSYGAINNFLRHQLLRLLARLQNSPWLRFVVRRIPLVWHTIIRDFLLSYKK